MCTGICVDEEERLELDKRRARVGLAAIKFGHHALSLELLEVRAQSIRRLTHLRSQCVEA